MMRSVRIFKLLMATGLIGFLGCATQAADTGYTNKLPVKGDEPKTLSLDDITFKFDKKGNLVPVAAKGVRFTECKHEEGQTQCRIFKTAIKVDEIDTIQMTVIKHHNSPDCLYVSTSRGRGGLESGTVSEACLNK